MRVAPIAAVAFCLGNLPPLPPPAFSFSVDTLIAPTGEGSEEVYGGSVGSVGDINGDGFCDFAVSAVQNDAGGANAGRVYLYFGGPEMSNEPDVVLTGPIPDDRFGTVVTSAGDENGDGYADLLVSAWGHWANEGKVYIYHGDSSLDTLPDLVLVGEATGDMFGNSADGGGDVNGDSYSDIIVGAPGNDASGSYAGRAYLYYGGPDADTIPDLTFTGPVANSNFGVSVGFAGDANGDGYDDMIVGAHWWGASGTGKAYIYFGGPGADNVADVVLSGEAIGDYFGNSVASAGDVNADGYGDLLVGAPGNDAGGDWAGSAYLFMGGLETNNTPDLVLTGDPGDRLGVVVACAGDVNRDGFADLLVGADQELTPGFNPGRAHVYFGGPALNTVADLVLAGERANDQFGHSVDGGGGCPAAEQPMFIIGARANDAAGVDFGRAYIFRVLPKVVHVPDDFPSIDEALGVVGHGDTVIVAPGGYREHDLVVPNGVALVAESGPDSTTIDAEQQGRVFHCVGVDSTTKIHGFTIRNGLAAPGGGVLCESSSPEISDCVFAFNTAEDSYGGGIALIGSSPRLTDCVFYENAAVWGGAVYCEDSSPRLSGCTIVANTALSGSGVDCRDSSTVVIENSIVAFGLVAEGVACATGSNAVLTCSDVYGNDMGDWVGCIAGQQGFFGNLHTDPLFCSAEYHMYNLYPESPCAAENNPTCGLIGALPVGCDFTAVAGGPDVPRAFSLSANWPNPFNPTTSIRFAVPERAVVDLTLYDTAGRRVAVLASGAYEAGEHTITWNGRDDTGRQVPSGTYFARLHAGEYGAVRKMVLLK